MDRQPDLAVAAARESDRPYGAVGIGDPYLPGSGNAGYRVRRYDLDLDYRVSSNRLAAGR